MKTCVMIFVLAVVACGFAQQQASDWPDYYLGENGVSRWRFNCDFNGRDIEFKPSTGEQCGGFCIANPSCNHFTYNNRVCALKNGDVNFARTNTNGPVCGFIPSRN